MQKNKTLKTLKNKKSRKKIQVLFIQQYIVLLRVNEIHGESNLFFKGPPGSKCK